MYEELIKVDYFYLDMYYCIGEGLSTKTAIFMESQNRVSLIREGTRRSLNTLESIRKGEIKTQDIQGYLLGVNDLLKHLFDNFLRTVLSGEEHEIKESVDKIKEILKQLTQS